MKKAYFNIKNKEGEIKTQVKVDYNKKTYEVGEIKNDKIINELKELGFKEKNLKFLGTWWNDRNIEIYEIEGKRIALYGWNGEIYNDCFEVSEDLMEIIKENIEVKPIYHEISEDNFEIIEYKII